VRSQECDNRAHNVVLDSKDVLELAVVVLRPTVRARCGIDQLGGDANAIATASYAPFQHVTHTQLAPDLTDIDRLTLVLEARISGDDEQL